MSKRQSKENEMSDPSGLKVVASVSFGDDEEEGLPQATDTLDFVPKGNKLIGYRCGHEGAEEFEMDFYGLRAQPNFSSEERLLECPACLVANLKRDTVRCAVCHHIIFPGDGVALYQNDGSFNQTIAHKVKTGESESVVGCMRFDCCPSGGFFSGHWTENGFVSAFEHGNAAAEAFATGKIVAGKI